MPKEANLLNSMLVLAACVLAVAAIAFVMSAPGTEPGPTATPTPLPQGTYSSVVFDPTKELVAASFANENEFAEFMKSHVGGSNYYYRGGMFMDVMPVAAQTSDISGGPKEGASIDYSTTNVQVQGVDEADLLKTDGEYIYTITGSTVFIIKAYPGADAKVVSTIHYDDATPTDLFIRNNRLAVFGGYYNDDYFTDKGFTPRNGVVFFDIYDVSDAANPEKIKDYKLEGQYTTGRMKEGTAFIVLNNGWDYRPIYPTPMLIEDDVVKPMPATSIHYFPIPYNYPSLVTVHAISLDTLECIDSESVAVEGGNNVYMSADNIYITYTEDVNEYELRNEILKQVLEPKLTEADRTLISLIKAVPNEVLSQMEKDAKILQVYNDHLYYMNSEEEAAINDEIDARLQEKLEEYEYFEYTVAHRLTVTPGGLSLAATGQVPGHVLNQFSMDEQDGMLRIATTVSPQWSWRFKDRSESVNNVFALDSSMDIIGSLKDLAKDEQIYSTRFMGDKLYMVTFRQVDPFFVIDLSDPRNIKELGHVKIPGFSRYLHPYDENTIIGLGQEATEQGRPTGLKISLFDVSDPTSPKEIAKYVATGRYSSSAAEYEHKAFLFSKAKSLLVIPAYSYDWDGGDSYNGALVFNITKESITLRGLIDHGGQYGGASVERSLYIEDELFTKSPSLLRINALSDLEGIKDVKLSASGMPVY